MYRKIFTIKNNQIELGAIVDTLVANGKSIPVIFVGEASWHNGLNYMPVILPNSLYEKWQKRGKIRIHFATINQNNYLVAASELKCLHDECLVVFRTPLGQGGKNAHKGDTKPDLRSHFPFPGNILKKGKIGHHFLGSFYSGTEIIATIPKNTMFSVHVICPIESPKNLITYYLFNGCYLEKISRRNRLSYTLKFKQDS